MPLPDKRCHIVHVLYRFAAGGLENVLVQLINGLPHAEFRHTVVALTTADAAFVQRILRPDVEIIAMNKAPGQPFRMYPAMFRLLRRLRPDVFHSCNLAALEFAPVAAAAGIRRRLHAEHGWDVADPDGSNRRYQLLRKVYKHFVHDFVAVSEQLRDYLLNRIDVSGKRVHLIPNGVDTGRFSPRGPGEVLPHGFPFNRRDHWVIGTVGRLEPIKNQPLLAQAFVELVRRNPPGADRLRLAIVGAGPLEAEVRAILQHADMVDRLWLPGARNDIPAVLQALDCFVLPSLSEGTSCTIQEAMACGLPIVATAVGGTPQLVRDGHTGHLVPSGNCEAMVAAMERLYVQPQWGLDVGRAAREHAVSAFGVLATINRYCAVFGFHKSEPEAKE